MNKKITGLEGKERERHNSLLLRRRANLRWKSGLNDPDCAQIDGESSIASVSAESHGLTLEFTFKVTSTLPRLYFWLRLHLPVKCCRTVGSVGEEEGAVGEEEGSVGEEEERGRGAVGEGADLSARWRTQRVELEWVGGLVNNAGQRGRTRPEEHGTTISTRRAYRVGSN